MASSAELSIALVAGEPSGDLLAGRLLSSLRTSLPQAHLHGIGGPQMMQHGFVSDWPMEKLAARGLFDVIRRYRSIKAIQTALRDRLLLERPAAYVGIDYGIFNLGLEEPLRHAGIPTVQFIGPQIWANRGGRIKQIIRAVSHMLVIFPFEEKIYRDAGVPVTYVGHPLAEVIPMRPDIAAARQGLNLPQDAPVVAILPGSRMSELKYIGPTFIAAARLLLQREPSLRFVVPMVGPAQKHYFQELLSQAGLQDLPLQVLDGQSHAALAAADAVLAASGTATLEVALFKKPMVIAYKMRAAEWHIMRHMAYIPWIGLPNILARDFIVPELLQNAATPEALADAVWRQLEDEQNRQALQQRFTDMHHSLLRDSARESAQALMKIVAPA